MPADTDNPATSQPLSLTPLVVDLDGTLCRTDTLWECFFAAWRTQWWLPLAVLGWLLRGRSHLKSQLAMHALPETGLLPWNQDVLSALREAKATGRATVLATAADERVARACANEVADIDDVMASGGGLNLKGETKAQRLVDRFGVSGFDYVGDSRADLPVWSKAAKKYTVSNVVPPAGERLGVFLTRSVAMSWVKLLRIRHWVKNILVFVAPVAAHAWSNTSGWMSVGLTFASFCAVCSGVYVLNDLFDLASDRTHPSKRKRPLAAGELPLGRAFFVALTLLAGGLLLAWWAGPGALAVVATYVAVNALYTAHVKRVPVFDVFFLAALYTLRIVAGAVAMSVPLSTWLVAFSVFAFLSLALLKRAADLARLSTDEPLPGRGYTGRDSAFVNGFGVASAIASCLVLALYVASDQVIGMYSDPLWLWGVAVVVLVWLARMWRMAMNGTMDDDPVLFATRDGVSWACAVATATCVLLSV